MRKHDPRWGEKIKRMRVGRGFNQATVARALGVSQMTVSRWELGVKSPARPAAVERMIECLPERYSDAREDGVVDTVEQLLWRADNIVDVDELITAYEDHNAGVRSAAKASRRRLAKNALMSLDDLVAFRDGLVLQFDDIAGALRAVAQSK